MKNKIAFFAVAFMAVSPVLATGQWSDDFSDPDTLVYWSSIIGSQEITGGQLHVSNSTDVQYGSYANQTPGLDYVSVVVNAQNAITGNDQGIMMRLDAGTQSFYGLNYDPCLDTMELIYSDPTNGFVNLGGESMTSGGTYGSIGRTVELRMAIYADGSSLQLVGQAYDTSGNLIGSAQCEVDGVLAYEGVTVPILSPSVTGLYAAMNMNEVSEGGLSSPNPCDTCFDDFVADTPVVGDANLDGVVGLADLTLLGSGWGTGDGWVDGDFNFDGSVGLADLTLLGAAWGSTGSGDPVTAPEPATMSLLGVGALTLLRRRRK